MGFCSFKCGIAYGVLSLNETKTLNEQRRYGKLAVFLLKDKVFQIHVIYLIYILRSAMKFKT